MKNKKFSLTAKKLIVRFGSEVALNIPELNLEGGVIGLAGRNGSGKSTLLKSILGFLRPQRGQVEVRRSQTKSKVKLDPIRDMTFVVDNSTLIDELSVESYLKLHCELTYKDPSHYRSKGSVFTDILHIPALFKQKCAQLSLREKNRLICCTTLMSKAKLLIFDEVLDCLDLTVSRQLIELFTASNISSSVILSSHRIDLIERIADSVVFMEQGEAKAAGRIDEVALSLCPSCICISHSGTNNTDLIQLLKRVYGNCLVYKIANRVFIAGKNLDAKSVEALLSRADSSLNFQVEETVASLHDSIHYKLLQSASTLD